MTQQGEQAVRSRPMTAPLEGVPLPDLERVPDYERWVLGGLTTASFASSGARIAGCSGTCQRPCVPNARRWNYTGPGSVAGASSTPT